MDRSFFEGQTDTLIDKCSFFDYFTRKEDISVQKREVPATFEKAFDARLSRFSQTNRYAQRSSFLNFWCTFSLSHQLNVLIF